ncbi:hypothetical protein Hanom_Chr00s011619g01747681 [Helianthus anomalus]
MSVRYRYGKVSVLYRILRVGIGIITIPCRTDTENAKKWIPIGIPIGILIGIGIGTGSVFGGICSSLLHSPKPTISIFRENSPAKATVSTRNRHVLI